MRVLCGQRPSKEFRRERRPQKTVRLSLALATLEEWVAAQEPKFALLGEGIEWPQIPAWIEFEKRRRSGNDALLRSENVKSRAQRSRGIVPVARVHVVPSSPVQAVDERLSGRDGFRRGESTVSRAIH